MIRKFSTALRITADKRLRYASPKLPSATSDTLKPLGDIVWVQKGGN